MTDNRTNPDKLRRSINSKSALSIALYVQDRLENLSDEISDDLCAAHLADLSFMQEQLVKLLEQALDVSPETRSQTER